MTSYTLERTTYRVQYFLEDLGSGVSLDMILVRGGTFLMGSPEDEVGHNNDESPQHEVTVPTFCLGRYPVTQAQWRVVAGWDKVQADFNPEPAHFKGDNLPVERVTWYEAVEFCQRLSDRTGRNYRLPSEAEWEYACRAGTTSPFYFGETLTTDLANYDGNSTYGEGVQGKYRGKTTPVGSLNAPNAFGLCDMHGNVYEWCVDPWHSNYEGAPIDGSVWEEGSDSSDYILRGGCWSSNPSFCRSAFRYGIDPSLLNDNIGFRLASSPRGSSPS